MLPYLRTQRRQNTAQSRPCAGAAARSHCSSPARRRSAPPTPRGSGVIWRSRRWVGLQLALFAVLRLRPFTPSPPPWIPAWLPTAIDPGRAPAAVDLSSPPHGTCPRPQHRPGPASASNKVHEQHLHARRRKPSSESIGNRGHPWLAASSGYSRRPGSTNFRCWSLHTC